MTALLVTALLVTALLVTDDIYIGLQILMCEFLYPVTVRDRVGWMEISKYLAAEVRCFWLQQWLHVTK